MAYYQAPPANTQVLCIDELGPLTARTYPGKGWAPIDKPLRVAPDYGCRAFLWIFGAFEPKTGKAFTVCSERRRSLDFVTFLDQTAQNWPNGELVFILDNLPVHKTMDVRLWAVAHERVRFLFQPTYAPWLNLIEPWWKTLRSLSLAGHRFENAADLRSSIIQGTMYWNDHRHPYLWRKSYNSN